MRRLATLSLAVLAIAAGTAARAEEIVHFTNGAEMTVRAHVIENEMVKLDLGGNSFISFPVSMVDKIASAGQDVFLNPVYHPTNQALPGAPGAQAIPQATYTVRGGGSPVGYRPGQSPNGLGNAMGEASDIPVPAGSWNDSGRVQQTGSLRGERLHTARPRFADPTRPVPPGAQVVLDPPGLKTQPQPHTMSPRSVEIPNASVPPKPADADVPPPPPVDTDPSGQPADTSNDQSDDPPPQQDPPENN